MLEIHAYISESFEDIASEMDHTNVNPEAVLQFDLFADALLWSDEYPPPRKDRLGDITCVRVLLRYRTTFLLGNPDQRLKPYWDQALLMFPNWAGFTPHRMKPTEELRNFYEKQKKIGDKSIIHFEKYCRRVNNLKKNDQ
jgi:hypothetical protein